MRLIRAVQIRYFRSIYVAHLRRCGRLNVVSGSNDVGKSNVLKALNLFFNGNTDWITPLDFYRDFSLQRLDEVRRESIKGRQFVSVQVEFERPNNYAGSLPPSFTVKRTWFRDGSRADSDDLEAQGRKGRLPSSAKTAQRFLQIFLGRVHYEYVPAVKDRAYFAHLLGRLQASLLDSPGGDAGPMVELAGGLADHIAGQVGQLRDDFRRATGLETSIEPPAGLGSLFQAFSVSTGGGEGRVPLVLRGDGMQARFVPSVLHYIAQLSKNFFIWGFEEPENSLEYGHAESLSRDFADAYSDSAQLFVTTHSPAFVALRDDGTSCYRATRDSGRTDIARIDSLDSAQSQALREDLGLMRIQAEIHAEYSRRLAELNAANRRAEALEAEMAAHQRPLLIGSPKSGVAEEGLSRSSRDRRSR